MKSLILSLILLTPLTSAWTFQVFNHGISNCATSSSVPHHLYNGHHLSTCLEAGSQPSDQTRCRWVTDGTSPERKSCLAGNALESKAGSFKVGNGTVCEIFTAKIGMGSSATGEGGCQGEGTKVTGGGDELCVAEKEGVITDGEQWYFQCEDVDV